ncbi:hypothetical protein [uncultured Sanguibacteroides sp.]|uniref:YIP1 family protein n=1 Tax=uncultured Sanguibacteroides sp. TaxID=1635151 RepID=UPI0025F41CD7|nr:hypothetical protein [uncultured Sanguibacteroides sp.]
MSKVHLKYIAIRLKHLLTSPEVEWNTIRMDETGRIELFRNYIILPSILFSILVFLFRLMSNDVMVSLGWGIINFIACTAGCYVCFRLTREYLSNKTINSGTIALKLSVYSSAVFILFHSLAVGFPQNFIGDVMAILSLLSLRTLYIGLNTISELNTRYKKSAVIIIGLLIICTPIIITRLLTIIFRIPAINA